MRRMLAKDPEERYPSAAALTAALDDVLAKIWGLAAPVENRAPTPEPGMGKSRRGLWIGVVIAALTAIVTATIAFVVGGRQGAVAPAPSAAASASVALSASVDGAPSRAPPPHAPDALERLRAASDGEAGAAIAVLVGIADAEPRAFADRAVQTEAAAIVESAASKGVATDAAFDRLSGPLGSDGVDILYDLTARAQRAEGPLGKPTSAGGKARLLLARPDVLSRGTPAMRVAYDLRRAACLQRPLLFARAGRDGDDRALEILRSISPPGCTRRDPCCFDKNRQLEIAIADIQARLRH
jgi:hypothetical protein